MYLLNWNYENTSFSGPKWRTGKFLSEVFIFESVNPQYDEILFIELKEKYKFRTCCVQILF